MPLLEESSRAGESTADSKTVPVQIHSTGFLVHFMGFYSTFKSHQIIDRTVNALLKDPRGRTESLFCFWSCFFPLLQIDVQRFALKRPRHRDCVKRASGRLKIHRPQRSLSGISSFWCLHFASIRFDTGIFLLPLTRHGTESKAPNKRVLRSFKADTWHFFSQFQPYWHLTKRISGTGADTLTALSTWSRVPFWSRVRHLSCMCRLRRYDYALPKR